MNPLTFAPPTRSISRMVQPTLWLAGLTILTLPGQAHSQSLSTAFGNYDAFPVGSQPEAVAIGDLNNDGRNDIVLTTSASGASTNIFIFFQSAGGALTAPVGYVGGAAPTSVAIADFTGDAKNDIAVGRQSAGIRVFVQGAGGAFDGFMDYPTANARWICSADFNNDGRADLAGIGWSSQQVDVLAQTTNGTLSVFGQYSVYYSGYNDLEAGDVNNDGLSDLIVMTGQNALNQFRVLLQTNGGFSTAVPYDLGASELAGGVGVGDLSGDGRNDVAMSSGGNRPNSKMTFFNQQLDGTLLRGVTTNSYDIPGAVVVADIDLNGRADVLTLHEGWQRLGVYFQTAPGGFETEKLFVIPYASLYNTHGLVVGDVNGDRMPDVAIADYNNGLVVLTNRLPPPPPPLRLTTMSLSNGIARFMLTGPVGSNCVVQVSSNLASWLPLLTNTIPAGGSLLVSDAGTINRPRGFYRAAFQAAGGDTFNDYFSNRTAIASSGGTVLGSNTGATKETGEPNHGASTGGKSVWWTWTAPASGIATVSLDGSSFDTLLGVYQGSAVGSLTLTAQDDDGGEGLRSRVVFNTTAGSVYQIAVDGFGGQSGNIQLTVKPGVLNDAFADRLQMTGASDIVVGSNVGATRQTGEPYHWPTTGGASVWWSWQAPLSGTVTLSTAGSSFDTILAAYTGNSVTGLTLIANNDDSVDVTSQISFFATAGTVYQIAVDGYSGATGAIRLSVQQ